MIFVTVGTQDKEFKRIFEMVDNQIKKGNIEQKVVAQIGSTNFNSDNMQIYKLMSKEDYNEYMKNAEFIIAHAGVGSILDGLKVNKKMIIVPRLKKYEEHVNDHQLQILEKFEERQHILAARDEEELEIALKKIDEFEPKPYKSNRENFVQILKNTIDSL